jgi:bifunctional UDP-N-acetylglucosamine pyrophosphorylase/glucosamine-1-phosphate N-acetyltransferase
MNRRVVALVLEPRVSARSGLPAPAAAPLLGRPALSYVLDAVAGLKPAWIVVSCGIEARAYKGPLKVPVSFLPSENTAAAAASGWASLFFGSLPRIRREGPCDILFIPADRPLLLARTMRMLLAVHRRRGNALTMTPGTAGRGGNGLAAARSEDLVPLTEAVKRSRPDALFTSLATILANRRKTVGLFEPSDPEDILAVSDPAGLGRASAVLRARKNDALARRGVSIMDPASAWIDWEAVVGRGSVVSPSVIVEGTSRIGKGCRIDPYVHIRDSRIGDRVHVLSSSVLDGCTLRHDSQVGPFTRLRPGTVVLRGAKVGNFVEMKNTVFGPRSKAMHLSYLGDSRVREDVNIGAGTITCNYDGVRKNRTEIGPGAFIGSGTELVAPVKVGRGAYVAAGSTITKDVGEESLAVARARQVEKPRWVAERLKKRRGRKS